MAKPGKTAAVVAYYSPRLAAALPNGTSGAIEAVLRDLAIAGWIAGARAAAAADQSIAKGVASNGLDLGAPADAGPEWAETAELDAADIPDAFSELSDLGDYADNLSSFDSPLDPEDQADQVAISTANGVAEDAAQASYAAGGISQWNSEIDSDNPCPACEEAAANGPYDVGAGPDLPIHSRCECESVPVTASEGRSHRTHERRAMPHKPPAAARDEMRNVPESRVSARSEFELREIADGTGGTNLRFTGFACVTDAEYEMEDWLGPWTESVTRGAFQKTLRDGADCGFLINHQGLHLARTKSGTLKLSEVLDPKNSPVPGVKGLHSEALLDPGNPHVQAMRSAVERGDLDEMSFGFRVTRQEWNAPDYDRRWIGEVSLDKGDVSLVNFGANPHTGETVAIRQRFFGRTAEETPPARARLLRGRRAAGDNCNRCDGEGTIHLQGQPVKCPQCAGSGTGENNAAGDDELERMMESARLDTIRARAQLERLRYPK